MILPRNGKETVQFTATIAANTTQTFNYVVKADATVEKIVGMFYPGQQNSLHVRPWLDLTGDRQEELVTYPNGTNRFLAGDNRAFDMPIDFAVNNGDQIMVTATNIDTVNSYTLQISFVVDYMSGKNRAG